MRALPVVVPLAEITNLRKIFLWCVAVSHKRERDETLEGNLARARDFTTTPRFFPLGHRPSNRENPTDENRRDSRLDETRKRDC